MEENINLMLSIQSAYNQLTKVEKKIADFVCKNREQVLYMSITELAEACGVAGASVYRFCRTMNLQGYQEFRVRLSLGISNGESALRQNAQYTSENLAKQVFDTNIKAIEESYMLMDEQSIAQVVSKMEKADRIFFFGLGDSLQTAKIGANRFLRITGKAYCADEPHEQAVVASLTTERDVIVIVSYSGATKDNLRVAEEAKKAGACLVVLTHYKKSELTEFADYILLCGAKETPLDGGSMAAKMGQLFLIDILYQEYFERNKKECKMKKEITAKAIMDKMW